MKRITAFFMAVILSVFIVPAVISPFFKGNMTEGGDAITAGSFSEPFKITVYRKNEGAVTETEFEEYLVGVLAGEMPPTYHTEALKAQAVAARSYILSKVSASLEGTVIEEHHGAMVCDDYKHCKAWRSIEEAKKGWDFRFADDYEEKLRNAVEKTRGEYMIYDNKVVKAYFYAISGGRTENAEDVWGSALPYLKSVSSDGDIGADGFESISNYPKDLFVQKLKSMNENVKIDDLKSSIGEIEHTDGGSVKSIEIGGQKFSGKDIREKFSLRSANFNIEISGDKVTFRVKGYGHGVGMSQNGANAMANKGKNYKSILRHYYSGVSIVNLYKKL